MPNDVFLRTQAGLTSLVSSRAASRILEGALKGRGHSPDNVDLSQMRSALLGPVLAELEGVLPRAGLHRNLERLARSLLTAETATTGLPSTPTGPATGDRTEDDPRKLESGSNPSDLERTAALSHEPREPGPSGATVRLPASGRTDNGQAQTGPADEPTDTRSADTGSADTGSADTGSADTGSADTGRSQTYATSPEPAYEWAAEAAAEGYPPVNLSWTDEMASSPSLEDPAAADHGRADRIRPANSLDSAPTRKLPTAEPLPDERLEELVLRFSQIEHVRLVCVIRQDGSSAISRGRGPDPSLLSRHARLALALLANGGAIRQLHLGHTAGQLFLYPLGPDLLVVVGNVDLNLGSVTTAFTAFSLEEDL